MEAKRGGPLTSLWNGWSRSNDSVVVMQCRCGSEKIKAHTLGDLDYILNQVDGRWILTDPRITAHYFSTRRPWEFTCMDCKEAWADKRFNPVFCSPAVTHDEIVLDLDHTLFYVEYYDKDSETHDLKFDFKFVAPDKRTYVVTKRPYLKEFLEACFARFKKINFFTAATDWYANKLIGSLNIPQEKLGFIKHQDHTVRGRPVTFDWELLKPMDNSLVVDDKAVVIEGFGNVIFRVRPYFPAEPDKDDELKQVAELFQKKESVIEPHSVVSGEVELMLRDMTIPFENLPIAALSDLLKIPPCSQAELKKLPVTTSFYEPWAEVRSGKAIVGFSELTYENYLKLVAVLKDYTKHKAEDGATYGQTLHKRAASFRKSSRDF